jgi:hypothetical protein
MLFVVFHSSHVFAEELILTGPGATDLAASPELAAELAATAAATAVAAGATDTWPFRWLRFWHWPLSRMGSVVRLHRLGVCMCRPKLCIVFVTADQADGAATPSGVHITAHHCTPLHWQITAHATLLQWAS